MSGSKLKKVSVKLKFSTTGGYSSEVAFNGSDPVATAVACIDELARILTIHGAGDQAIAAATDAVRRVNAEPVF